MALSGRTIPVGFSVGCTLGNLLAVPVKREKGITPFSIRSIKKKLFEFES